MKTLAADLACVASDKHPRGVGGGMKLVKVSIETPKGGKNLGALRAGEGPSGGPNRQGKCGPLGNVFETPFPGGEVAAIKRVGQCPLGRALDESLEVLGIISSHIDPRGQRDVPWFLFFFEEAREPH